MIKGMINRIRYGNKASSDIYINYLRSIGVKVGDGVRFFAPMTNTIDIQNPYMIEIGNNVRITKGVIILTHDYSWSVLSGIEGEVYGAISKVCIGNNVFIGINSIILRGVNIGDNVIIGAGSVVSKDCKSNAVYAGNPAKFIMSIEEFYIRRKKAQISEARDLAITYNKKTGENPSEDTMEEYFSLYTNLNEVKSTKIIERIKRTGYYDLCIRNYQNKEPIFKNLDDFLSSIK
ncbi:MAG: acyltransferase [Clostridium sp.]|uniref:acyltransferase n=1 Tax=Clostridia TaxID=186801 RepID=UPI0039927733